jgi:hypothetical protein
VLVIDEAIAPAVDELPTDPEGAAMHWPGELPPFSTCPIT